MQQPDYHPLSWNDPFGRLYWRDGRLFRAIRESRAEFYGSLLGATYFQELMSSGGVIPTWVSSEQLSGYPLVLEHKVLPFVSYPSEWCGAQLASAATMLLRLERTLRANGATIMDANPWNVLFDFAKPVLVDFGCIYPLEDASAWPGRREIQEFYLNPLKLIEAGQHRIARRLLNDPWIGITDDDVWRSPRTSPPSPVVDDQPSPVVDDRVSPPVEQVRTPRRPYLRRLTDKVLGIVALANATGQPSATPDKNDTRPHEVVIAGPEPIPTTFLGQMEKAEADLEGFNLFNKRTDWKGYYENNFPDFDDTSRWTLKHHSVKRALTLCRPKTVLDIGGNRGWYSHLAARSGAQVIASDSDENSLSQLTGDLENSNLPILPVYMDIRFPEPAQGPGYAWFSSAASRFRVEMVLALAIVHHLTFTWHLSFSQIVSAFSCFTSDWLVVEFVGPQDDVVMSAWRYAPQYPDYSLHRFKEALSDEFSIEDVLESDAGGLDDRPPDRTILLCRRKAQRS